MKTRVTTLFAALFALSITSSAFAGDDFWRMIVREALREVDHQEFDHRDRHDFDHEDHNHHGQNFNYGQNFNPGTHFHHGPQPEVLPYVNPGVVERPRLDINGHYVHGQGMLITRVVCGGLAERLGLERGDTIVAINGEEVTCQHRYFELLREAVLYHGGHAQLLVRNVRGWPAYVMVDAHFPCSTHPVLYHHHP